MGQPETKVCDQRSRLRLAGGKLKRLLAEQMLAMAAMKELLSKKW